LVNERTEEAVRQKEEIQLQSLQLEDTNKKLEKLASLDSLMGIANVRKFQEFPRHE